MMPNYHIGTLTPAALATLTTDKSSSSSDSTSAPRAVFLQPKSWSKATLHAKKTVSWDTRVFTFALEHPCQTLGLPTGQHLMMRLRDPVTHDALIRSYTPISHETRQGYLDVLVKVYFPSADGSSAGGKMSLALDSLPVGHAIDFKGPIGKFEYLGRGRCAVNGRERNVSSFVMICGGSGVTPVFQVFRSIMMDEEDPTHVTLLDGNRVVEDILIKDELDAHAQKNPHKCKLLYTLTQPPEQGWEGLKGRIGASLLNEHASPQLEHFSKGGRMALVCGPEALERSVGEVLLQMGWESDEVLFF